MKNQGKNKQKPLEQTAAKGKPSIETFWKTSPNIENILDSITDAFALIDQQWRLTYVNPAAAQLMDKPLDEILGQVCWSLFPETKETNFYTQLHRAMEENVPVHFEALYSPSAHWYECDAYPSADGLSVFFRNITERKQMERQLRERAEEIEKLMEVLPLGIVFAHDPECQRITGNPTAHKLLQLPPQVNLSKTAPPNERPLNYKVCRNGHEIPPQELPLQYAATHGVEVRDSEFDLVFNDGSANSIYGYASPLFDEQGQVRGCIGAFMDITERKRAEEALSESQRRLSAVIQASNASYYEFATDFSWGTIDRRFAAMLGYSLDEIPPVPERWDWWEQRLHPEDHERTLQAYHDFVQDLIPVLRQEYRLRHKDGSWLWWRVVSTTVKRNSQGYATAIAGLIFDITEQRQAEEALRESEERFRVMAETVPDIIFTSRPDGSREYTNPRFYEHTRLTPEAAEGSGWMAALHPDDLEQVKTRWRHSVETGELFEAQYRLRDGNGRYRWFQGRARPIRNETGQITKWFGACSDIHDLVHIQEALKETDRCKNEFLAMLGHELRNPLAPICNAVELMRMHLHHPAIQNKSIDIIDRQAKHLTRLVDDLLNVARIVTGKINLKTQPVELKEVVMQAVETAQPAIESARHELTLSLPAQPLKAEADPVRLVQIVANLLNNAVNYTPSGGHIQLRVAQSQEGEAIIQVRDNGVGISPEKLPYIFDIFTQADRSFDQAQSGLGLGLTLVHRLTEMHGGKAFAFSEGPGRGSEFTIHLPLILESASQEIPPTPSGARNPGLRRILVVDDEPDVRASFTLLLEALGHEVMMAPDGPSAIEAAHNFQPEMVFLDISMPGMDGYETARRLREKHSQEKMMLIAWTGHDLEGYRDRSEQAGFDHYLLKPIDIQVVETLLASRLPQKGTG